MGFIKSLTTTIHLIMIRVIYFLISLFVFSFQVEAQIQSKTSNNLSKKPQIDILKLVQDKAAKNISYIITAQHTSRTSGVHHMYLRQAINGIEIIGSESSINSAQDRTILKKNNKKKKQIILHSVQKLVDIRMSVKKTDIYF